MFQTTLYGTENAYLLFNNFSSESHVAYVVMWKNMIELDRPQMAV